MICRWTTTSSALVGSSARITFGLRHVAIASTALCFIPPLSSWGNIRATAGDSPTLMSSSATLSLSWERVGFRVRSMAVSDDSLLFSEFLMLVCTWSSMPSVICFSILITGLREFIAPWGTSAISASLARRISASDICNRSLPDSVMDPDTILPGGLVIRMSAVAIVLLPLPDSPTKASLSPCLSSNETPLTALTAPTGVS